MRGMQDLAAVVVRHPFAVFLALAVLTLLLTAALWTLIQRLRALTWFDGRELLWHLGLGFGVVLVGLSVFFELADEIGIDEDLGRFDDALAVALRDTLQPQALQLFSWVTHLGDVWTLVGIAVAVTLVLLFMRRPWLALSWVVATGGNGLLNRALKAVYERTRPLHDHGYASAGGWSFPSGHASGSLVVYGMLAYVLLRCLPQARPLPLALSVIALALLIGYSRIVLQVHYFSDVLAGYASGGAWLAVCIAGAEIARASRQTPAKTSSS